MTQKLISKFLKENDFNLESSDSNGLQISLVNDEITLKWSKLDLIELADYLLDVAISQDEKNHLHIDELTLIDNNLPIKNLIIEKF